MKEPYRQVLMKCGHVANSLYGKDNQPCCLICAPKPEAFEKITVLPNLIGRKAKCSDCDNIVDSNWYLPFFEYRPNEEYDKYYCGCFGWN